MHDEVVLVIVWSRSQVMIASALHFGLCVISHCCGSFPGASCHLMGGVSCLDTECRQRSQAFILLTYEANDELMSLSKSSFWVPMTLTYTSCAVQKCFPLPVYTEE